MSADGVWLRARGLTKRYGGTTALNAVDFELRPGEIRGLVGANGAGKSTFVKVVAGEVTPDYGEILIDGEAVQFRKPADARAAGIVDVPQELSVAPNLSVADNVMLGHFPHRAGRVDAGRTRAAAARALDILGLTPPLGAPVGSLQPIEQRLVMVARALAREARLVLFDEPTATASPAEVARILAAVRLLSERGVSVLYVSHRLDEVVELCGAVTVMRDGRAIAELAVDGSTRETLVGLMSAAPGDSQVQPRPARRPRADAGALLEVDELVGGRVRGVTLSVRAGEILGVTGLVGSGAADLPLMLCGALRRESGSVTLAGTPVRAGQVSAAVAAGIGFLSGDRRIGVLPSHSVMANISLPGIARYARLGIVSRRRELAAVREVSAPAALTAGPEVKVATLSGGNQQKALFARWLATEARLLILDDPTAGVDVGSRKEIHARLEGLLERGVGMVLVSTDLEELATLADRVVVLDRGTVRAELDADGLTEGRLLDVLSAGHSATAAMTDSGEGATQP